MEDRPLWLPDNHISVIISHISGIVKNKNIFCDFWHFMVKWRYEEDIMRDNGGSSEPVFDG